MMMEIGHLTSAACIRRCATNPVLAAADIPYPAALIFNAGVTKYQGEYVMVFRNDYCGDDPRKLKGTSIGLARSKDGVMWTVSPKPCFGRDDLCKAVAHLYPGRSAEAEIGRGYDPRLTVIDGKVYMCFAVDTRHGLRGGIAVTEDFDKFEVLSLSAPDNRNMVLFPEKIGGMYARLERPMPVYSHGGKHRFDIWLSRSADLMTWPTPYLVLGADEVPFCNDKIGPAAPPVKTRKGWLTTFHAVDVDPSRGKNGWEATWTKRYTAGIMLLDAEEPWKVVGMSKQPLISPEAQYEIDGGFRNNVIFPGGMVLEDSGEVKIYYGSADAVECLAMADVEELLALCKEPR